MARITLSSNNFAPVSEGEHTFTVKSVEYKEAFGKIQVRLVTEKGEQHTEFFNILNNDKALFAFTMTAKALMGDNNITDIEPNDLVGKSMLATVEQYIGNDGKTYARLTDKKPVGSVAVATEETTEESADDIFGNLFED